MTPRQTAVVTFTAFCASLLVGRYFFEPGPEKRAAAIQGQVERALKENAIPVAASGAAPVADTEDPAMPSIFGMVRDLNTKVESFPANILAKTFKFTQAEFFEIGNAEEREVVAVNFKNT